MKLILVNSDTGRFLALGIPDTDDLGQATTFPKHRVDRARAVQAVMAKYALSLSLLELKKSKSLLKAPRESLDEDLT